MWGPCKPSKQPHKHPWFSTSITVSTFTPCQCSEGREDEVGIEPVSRNKCACWWNTSQASWIREETGDCSPIMLLLGLFLSSLNGSICKTYRVLCDLTNEDTVLDEFMSWRRAQEQWYHNKGIQMFSFTCTEWKWTGCNIFCVYRVYISCVAVAIIWIKISQRTRAYPVRKELLMFEHDQKIYTGHFLHEVHRFHLPQKMY